MHRSSVCLALLILAFANPAAAQRGERADRLDLRSLRQQQAAPLRLTKAETQAEWNVAVGASYVDAQDGSDTFATPFNLKAPLRETNADLRIGGEGYQYIDAADSDKAGLADILFALAYKFGKGDHKVVPEAGFYFPAGGEVGSSTWKQRAGLAYTGNFGERFSLATRARVVRDSADQDPGVSRYKSALAGDLGFALKKDVNEVSVSLTRAYRRGVGGATEAGVGYSHVIGTAELSVAYARGLTAGSKDNTFELTIGRSF